MAATMTELRLDSFKSIKSGRMPLGPLTLIVGRNGSGKSNILDALAVLSALAGGQSLRDALDGGREGPVVRGGSEGCAPLGADGFEIGCSVDHAGTVYHLDLDIQTTPTLQIRSEKLWTERLSGPHRGDPQHLWATDPPAPHSADIVARWDNGKRGMNPPVTMRADQLITSQIAVRVPATSAAGRHVHEVAAAVIQAISAVFLLDPVPHQMREYVPEKDTRLRRNAENLSGALAQILRDASARESLLEMTSSLSEAQVSSLTTVSGPFGEVMVTIEEMIEGRRQPVPARLMSDGTLRFLAIAAAMWDTQEVGDERLLVVEEVENGLHPSQAALLLRRLKQAAERRGVRTIATTHSPTILDAIEGGDHESVFVTTRGHDGWSRITRLTDFPDYFEVVGANTLGAAALADRLRPSSVDPEDAISSLAAILGA